MDEPLSADYLVVGAGAMGMAFVDTLLSDSKATVALVDRYTRPGGHWTIAYPHVRLHQPSIYYGVNSRRLGEDNIDEVGWNKGLWELPTVDEVCAYYSTVMHRTFLPSARVAYYPKHEYVGDGQFRNIVTNKVLRVGDKTRIVDATYMRVEVPAMRPPTYGVADGVTVIPPNDLAKIARPWGGYTVVGAGKTGIDACLWLLAQGVDPHIITWVMPRDPWFLERGCIQPGESSITNVAATVDATMNASSVEDWFLRLENATQVLRMTDKIMPTNFRCSTISLAEFEGVKNVGTIVRQGRVVRIGSDEVVMEQGTYQPVPDTLYIDCAADALAKRPVVPVFNGRQITLQSVRYCQQVFSAALIAHIEVTYDDDSLRNELCGVVPHPTEPIDYLIVNCLSLQNRLKWDAQPKTAAWLSQARLDWFGKLTPPVPEDPAEAAEFRAVLKSQTEAICTRFEELTGHAPGKNVLKAEGQTARL